MMSPRVVTVVQARLGSTRLPGKVLRPLCHKPLLARLVERVKMATLVGTVVVATTTAAEDDPIEALCHEEGYFCFRGHPTDLLDRHYRAGWQFDADIVVKIPSVCPLIDPRLIDRVITAFLDAPEPYDYLSNMHPATYPDGNDVEVMAMPALETAWIEAERPFEREHTTPFFWENPARFRLGNVTWETGLDYSMSHRWTIDYEADYCFIHNVFAALYPQNPQFGLTDILQLLTCQPELAAINQHLAGVNWYRHHLSELKTVNATMTREEPVAKTAVPSAPLIRQGGSVAL